MSLDRLARGYYDRACVGCGMTLDELQQDEWAIELRQRQLPGDIVPRLDVPHLEPFCSLDCFRDWIENEPKEIYGENE